CGSGAGHGRTAALRESRAMSKSGALPSNRRALLFVVLVAMAAATWLIVAALRRPAPPAAPAVTATPVTTATAHRGPIERTVSIMGTVRWQTETQLAARIPARVLTVAVHEGDRVRRSQLLVQL